jgi:hypothetical protein
MIIIVQKILPVALFIAIFVPAMVFAGNVPLENHFLQVIVEHFSFR